MGAVERCHKEWASITLAHGGKSNSSRAVAAVVSATKSAALVAYAGRYDFGLDGNLRNNGIDVGREYNSQRALWQRPTVKLKVILYA